MADIFTMFVMFVLLIFFIWFSSVFFGAPFQPSSDKAVKQMLELAKVRKKDKAADLGSGNGKIVIAFAQKGAEAHGYEINPLLVWISRSRIRRMHLQKKAFIHWGNFMKANLSKFNIVTSFQINFIMPGLEKKLKKIEERF